MAIDPAFVGLKSEPRHVLVEEGFLRLFAKAIGETRPIYVDPEYARANGLRGLLAPPTYLFCLHLASPPQRGDPFDPDGMAVDPLRALHGEQSFEAHHPFYAGDTLTLVTETTDVSSKRDGALELLTQKTDAFLDTGEICASMIMTMVIRRG